MLEVAHLSFYTLPQKKCYFDCCYTSKSICSGSSWRQSIHSIVIWLLSIVHTVIGSKEQCLSFGEFWLICGRFVPSNGNDSNTNCLHCPRVEILVRSGLGAVLPLREIQILIWGSFSLHKRKGQASHKI